jgi:hypothetical protein
MDQNPEPEDKVRTMKCLGCVTKFESGLLFPYRAWVPSLMERLGKVIGHENVEYDFAKNLETLVESEFVIL